MLLRAESIALLGLAVALAIPVPEALARARWTTRAPRAALILWQAVGLGGGLGILGGGLTLAVASESGHWLTGLAAMPHQWSRLGSAGWGGVAVTLVAGAWLLAIAVLSAVRVVLARRAHRRRLDLVADRFCPPAPGGREPGPAVRDVQLVDHPRATAYCLPGLRPRVVVTRGALYALDEVELAAVLAHERAHAQGRHDLVVQPFLAWRRTFPFLPSAWRAVAAVELLVEMLADDAARRTCGTLELHAALQHLAVEHRVHAAHDDPCLDAQVAARTARLLAPPCPLPALVRAGVYAAAAALVLVPPLVLVLS